jgi:CRISPR-associated protein Cas5d
MNMVRLAYPINMEIAGNTAMWTRPDTGDCPVSYPAPTYSAVKAIFESIFWGPAVMIVPTKVEICAPIQYHNYFTNYGGPLRKSTSIKDGNSYQLLATVLIDVCYRLHAEVLPNANKNNLSESALAWDRKTTSPGHAYQDMFYRRLKRGQAYSVPTLGWREFTPTYFGEFRADTCVLTDLPQIVIPSMLRQVFSHGYKSAVSYEYDQNLVIRDGVLEFPQKTVRYAK